MVNNQTSQNKILNKFLLVPFMHFQCVREILQLSLPIDHSVVGAIAPPFLNFKYSNNLDYLVCYVLHHSQQGNTEIQLFNISSEQGVYSINPEKNLNGFFGTFLKLKVFFILLLHI